MAHPLGNKSIISLGLIGDKYFVDHQNTQHGANYRNPYFTKSSLIDYLKSEVSKLNGRAIELRNGYEQKIIEGVVSNLSQNDFSSVISLSGLESLTAVA